jgi:hypothetical protein
MQTNKPFYRKYTFWLGLLSFLVLTLLQHFGHPLRYTIVWWLELGFGVLTVIFFLIVGFHANDISKHDQQ